MVYLPNVIKKVARRIIASHPLVARFSLINTAMAEFDAELNTWALRISQRFTEEDFNSLSILKLKWVLRQASEVPYWQSIFRNTSFKPDGLLAVEDIERLPITRREEMMSIPLAARSNQKKAKELKSTLGLTSGSTGHPLHFYRSRRSKIRTQALYRLIMDQARAVGKLESDKPRVFNFGLPRLIPIYPWVGFMYPLVLEEGTLSRDRLYRFFGDHKVEVIFTYASLLKRLQHWWERDGRFFQFKAIIYTSQSLDPLEREAISRFFNCPIFSVYGAKECSVLGIECPRQPDKFHLVPELGYAEIVDDKGVHLPYGVAGNVVYTYFENEISPFIRYGLGDLGRVEKNVGCGCGRNSDFIIFEGKTADIIYLPNGNGIICKALSIAIDKILFNKVYQFQMVQQGKDQFILRVVPRSSLRTVDEEKITAVLGGMLQNSMKINIERASRIAQLPSGKTPLFLKI